MNILQQLEQQRQQWQQCQLRDLFANNSSRFSQFSLQTDRLLLDYSKNHLDSSAVTVLAKAADQVALADAIEGLFAQDNHTACRQVGPLATLLQQFQSIIDSWGDTVTDIIHVGVGGSMAGPLLATEALSGFAKQHYRVHFIGAFNRARLQRLLQTLDRKRSRVLIASKSFATPETIFNAQLLKQWLGGCQQMLALTANAQRAGEFGIAQQHIVTMSQAVGGRYSLWSAIGFVIAVGLELSTFEQLLQGAAAMDQHFRQADWCHNMPVLLAFIDVWYQAVFAINNRAIIPYAMDLHGIIDYLQQLHMESLGKSVDQHNRPIDYATGTIIWGGVGTQCQHSFFQLLLQGQQHSCLDFILPLKNCQQQPTDIERMANCLAQSQVMMQGDPTQTGKRFIRGNVPSNTLLLEDLTPYSLGMLLALYEHKVFTQSVLWNINAFDQWGVERGKQLAASLQQQLHNKTISDTLDSSSRGLARAILQSQSHKESVV